jgi:hypothetical protein
VCANYFTHNNNIIGSEIPAGYVAQAIHGFVEELVVNDDPEYQVRKNNAIQCMRTYSLICLCYIHLGPVRIGVEG